MVRTRSLLILALALWLAAGCAAGGQQQSAQTEGAGLATGTFAGEAPEADAFVALIADDPKQGEDAREVRAYLCDGKRINEWFRGSAEANDLRLTSTEGEYRLEGELAPEAATGTITLADGRSVPFEAAPATGVGGLYDVRLATDGRLSGTSETGGRLEGRLGGELEGGRHPLSGTITPPEGQPRDFEASSTSAEPGEFRWVVLPDGEAKGAKNGEGVGFIETGSDI